MSNPPSGVNGTDLRCPSCDVTGPPATRLGNLAICGHCGSTLAVNLDGTIRRATAMDTDVLAPRDRALLVKARSAIARPKTH